MDYYHFASYNTIINDHQWLLSPLGEKLFGKNPEMDPHKHAQLTVDKAAKEFNGGRTDFSTNGAGASGYL